MVFVPNDNLKKEIQTNIEYLWFLGFFLSAPIPDQSTMSWNRRTRFLYIQIFFKRF
ncbi:transposase [Bacillus sp. SRB3LM]|uniref:transposase n=1 Tax=Bacillus sp. SRB3LM TaxID=2608689 RepID=UPI0035A8ED64